jgi:hypothetical protein
MRIMSNEINIIPKNIQLSTGKSCNNRFVHWILVPDLILIQLSNITK